MLEVLEEALSARVIEELTPTRRVRLHARIAETLEQLYDDNLEAQGAELAYHFAKADVVLGPALRVNPDNLYMLCYGCYVLTFHD